MVPACSNGCDGWYKVQPNDLKRFEHRRLFAIPRIAFTTAFATALTIIFAIITTTTAFPAFTVFTVFPVFTAFTIIVTTATGTTGAFAAPTGVSTPRAVPQAAAFNTPARPHGAVLAEKERV